MMDLIIVIPFYNEFNRIDLEKYSYFLKKNPKVYLILVNDGSKDKTFKKLDILKEQYCKQIEIISVIKNQGKASSIRKGMLYAHDNLKAKKIGFLDADLATSFNEMLRLSSYVDEKTLLVFGSRILKLNNKISRKRYRFIIGRIVATIISKIIKEPIYDTQCGCKVMSFSIIPHLFSEKFISTWLFDIEIFLRLKVKFNTTSLKKICLEIPLKKWTDTEDSRVSFLYFFKLWSDLLKIHLFYKNKI